MQQPAQHLPQQQGATNNQLQHTGAPSPSQVSSQFTEKYYSIRTAHPNYLVKFYGPTSKVTLNDGTSTKVYTGPMEISQGQNIFAGAVVQPTSINCTDIPGTQGARGGYMLQVCGNIRQKNGQSQKFAQSFFLVHADGTENHLIVSNDMTTLFSPDTQYSYLPYSMQHMPSTGTMDPNFMLVQQQAPVQQHQHQQQLRPGLVHGVDNAVPMSHNNSVPQMYQQQGQPSPAQQGRWVSQQQQSPALGHQSSQMQPGNQVAMALSPRAQASQNPGGRPQQIHPQQPVMQMPYGYPPQPNPHPQPHPQPQQFTPQQHPQYSAHPVYQAPQQPNDSGLPPAVATPAPAAYSHVKNTIQSETQTEENANPYVGNQQDIGLSQRQSGIEGNISQQGSYQQADQQRQGVPRASAPNHRIQNSNSTSPIRRELSNASVASVPRPKEQQHASQSQVIKVRRTSAASIDGSTSSSPQPHTINQQSNGNGVVEVQTSGASYRPPSRPGSYAQNIGGSQYFSIIAQNLPLEISDDQVRGIFSPYGQVLGLKVKPSKDSDQLRTAEKSYAFVDFGTEEEMRSAVANCDHIVFEGRQISVQEKKPRLQSYPSRGAYRGGPHRDVRSFGRGEMTRGRGRSDISQRGRGRGRDDRGRGGRSQRSQTPTSRN